ncbi:MAG: sugar phosphate isomerase/epimerase [Akkermansiaceae bacterium]|nr:sugar phosphate isomerase/epimerase [Akkermansiaceae bacterium]NNM30264.1 sugar phosphate isomerase/epimerase [Akkermansiaceae bacterium]
MNRRTACQLLTSASAAHLAGNLASAADTKQDRFALRYILSSAMYGTMPLDVILPEIGKTGSEAIDIWCLKHGNQREQIDAMGFDAFEALLAKHGARVGVFTRYPLGPFGLQDEMKVAKRFGAGVLVCGSSKPSEPSGAEAKKAVRDFLEKMKPHVAAAEKHGVTIAVENHDKQLLYHPDSLRYFAEFNRSPNLGVAFAPHHLHQWEDEIPALLRDLGNEQVPFVYFQEHSEGIRRKAPKEIEMQQMPGFGGGLDYKPVVKALKDIAYDGWVEIFMHPVPRGIPILPTAGAVTAAINKSRKYVEECLQAVS